MDSKLTRITSTTTTTTTTTTSDSARRPQGEARQLCAEGALAGEEPARLQELPAAAQQGGAERVVTSHASRSLIEESSPSTIVLKSQTNSK